MRSYSLADFEAVLAIGRTESFRAAALDLGLSTSALSTMIAKLESQLRACSTAPRAALL